jgi:hypothetical protein
VVRVMLRIQSVAGGHLDTRGQQRTRREGKGYPLVSTSHGDANPRLQQLQTARRLNDGENGDLETKRESKFGCVCWLPFFCATGGGHWPMISMCCNLPPPCRLWGPLQMRLQSRYNKLIPGLFRTLHHFPSNALIRNS